MQTSPVTVVVVALVVVTPPFPRDRDTAQTAILVHAVDLIELGQGKCDGVVVRASASQSVDMGFIPLVE